jgi:hypothetical protein
MTSSLPVRSFKWSLSSLSTYEKCPAQYKYRYIDGLTSAKGAAAARGVSTHAVVEGYLKGELTAVTSELSFYQGFLDELKKAGAKSEEKLALTKSWEPTAWDGAWWRGILDCLVFPTPEEAILYDWKTGKIYPDHDDQKALYSLAVLSTFPAVRFVRAVHVYLDLGKNQQKGYSQSQVHMLREFWGNRVARLERDVNFITKPGFYCRYCPFSRAQNGPCKF